MAKELERRSYDFEVTAQDTDKGSVITGRPIVYNSRSNIGLFDEIIETGALSTTDLTDVRFLVNHDRSKIPLARSRRNNGNSTMRLIPDDKGLAIEVQLDTENNAEARSLYSAVKRGDLTGMSFLFGVPKGGDDWENLNTDHPTRHIRSISSVVEVSAVTFPAYEATEIYARSKEALDNARSALESARQQSEKSLDSELELLKEKTKLLTMRFNPNHDAKGRFAPTYGGGGGSAGGSSGGSGGSTGKKRKFVDTESGQTITEDELKAEFEELKKEDPDTYDYSFEDYLKNATSGNGFLMDEETYKKQQKLWEDINL